MQLGVPIFCAAYTLLLLFSPPGPVNPSREGYTLLGMKGRAGLESLHVQAQRGLQNFSLQMRKSRPREKTGLVHSCSIRVRTLVVLAFGGSKALKSNQIVLGSPSMKKGAHLVEGGRRL